MPPHEDPATLLHPCFFRGPRWGPGFPPAGLPGADGSGRRKGKRWGKAARLCAEGSCRQQEAAPLLRAGGSSRASARHRQHGLSLSPAPWDEASVILIHPQGSKGGCVAGHVPQRAALPSCSSRWGSSASASRGTLSCGRRSRRDL